MLGLLFVGFLIGLAIAWNDDSPGREPKTVTVEKTEWRTHYETTEITTPCKCEKPEPEKTLPETGGPGE